MNGPWKANQGGSALHGKSQAATSRTSCWAGRKWSWGWQWGQNMWALTKGTGAVHPKWARTITMDSQGTSDHHTSPSQGTCPRPSQEAKPAGDGRQGMGLRTSRWRMRASGGRETPERFLAGFPVPALSQQAALRPWGCTMPGQPWMWTPRRQSKLLCLSPWALTLWA